MADTMQNKNSATVQTEAMTFEKVSQMPAITWHFLDMNDTSITVPAGMAIQPYVQVTMPFTARGAQDEFENAMADAQEVWEHTHPEPTEEEVKALQEAMAAEADATYGGTARSNYQIYADSVEEARSLMAAFESGTDGEVSAFLRYAAGEHTVIMADAGKCVDASVVVSAAPDTLSVAAVDVVADKDSTVNLTLLVECGSDMHAAAVNAATQTGAGDAFGDVDALAVQEAMNAMAGTTLRVFADAGAKVNIVRTQALCNGAVDVDDMGLFAARGASIDVRQTVLGAARSYTGLACDLRGDTADITIDTHYLGHGNQERDFNYIVRHHGQKTESNLMANGVLAERSRKVLRGTIDFVRGCCGSEGSENETVLLIDESVRNKTVPTLLCNEDDVVGNHGATIGHIRDEQLFYLGSRGLSPEAAERMFASAMLEQAMLDAPDEPTRQAVVRLGETIKPGFRALFDEEA